MRGPADSTRRARDSVRAGASKPVVLHGNRVTRVRRTRRAHDALHKEGQCCGIFETLARSLTEVRRHRVRGIADEYRPAPRERT